jgi:N-acetylneuraminic acid mutarotase
MERILFSAIVSFGFAILFLSGCQKDKGTSFPAIEKPTQEDTLPGKWIRLEDAPLGFTELPIVSLTNKIYVAGGMINGTASDNFMCYDHQTGTWEFLPALPLAVDHHSVAIVEDTLYVIGGHCSGILNTFKTVYGYCISTGTWSQKASLPSPLAAGAAVSFEGMIFQFGGTDAFIGHAARNYFPGILRYDPELDEWQTVGPYIHTREHITSLQIGKLIYILGGRIYNGEEFVTFERVETYSPETGKWDYITSLPAASSGLLAATWKNRLCVFGGEDLSIVELADLHHAYDLENGSWEEITPLPLPRHGITAVTLDCGIHILGGGPQAFSALATRSHFELIFE